MQEQDLLERAIRGLDIAQRAKRRRLCQAFTADEEGPIIEALDAFGVLLAPRLEQEAEHETADTGERSGADDD